MHVYLCALGVRESETKETKETIIYIIHIHSFFGVLGAYHLPVLWSVKIPGGKQRKTRAKEDDTVHGSMISVLLRGLEDAVVEQVTADCSSVT